MTDPEAVVPNAALSEIPRIGLGTYPLRGDAAVRAVSSALSLGYRLVDTAVHYGNEAEVGRGMRASGVPRDEVWVATKLPGRHHARADAFSSIHSSLRTLGLDYVDLYLIHWPNPGEGLFVEAWQALIELQEAGLVRHVGVSNFTPDHVAQLGRETGVLPAVNQIEMHPLFPQARQRAVHEGLGITTMAWSPLGRGQLSLTAPAITAAAERCGVTPAQVVLRWHVQLGSIPVPKSSNPARQLENLDIFAFELTAAEVLAISALGRLDGRTGGDPDVYVEM